MVLDVKKNVITRVEAMLAGHKECCGVFRVVDQSGLPLDGVDVCYKVGHSDWIPCGRSRLDAENSPNFSQPSTLFYPIGEPVKWRFSKDGYADVTITRYTADTEFDAKLDHVIMTQTSGAIEVGVSKERAIA